MYSFLDDEEQKPDIKSYLAEKHNLDPVTLQPREAAQKQYDEQVDRSNTANLFANLGDVIAGKRPGQSNQFFSDLNKQAKENTVGKLDADRKRQMEDATFANAQKKSQHENDQYDPNTNASQSFRKMIEAKFPDVAKVYGDAWQNVSAADQENIFKPLQLKEQIDARKQIAAMAAAAKTEAKNAGATEGQKAVDRDFAKDYNEWTSSGRSVVDKNLQRLEDAKAKISAMKEDFIQPSGRFIGRVPDLLTPEPNLTLRQDVQSAAQGALKATLGAQFTENEGKRIMQMAYDERLSPQANIDKINAAISELKNNKKMQDSKSRYFEAKGSLTGFKNEVNPKTGETSDQTKVVNGKTYKKVQGGWEEI